MPSDGMSKAERFYAELSAKEFDKLFTKWAKRAKPDPLDLRCQECGGPIDSGDYEGDVLICQDCTDKRIEDNLNSREF